MGRLVSFREALAKAFNLHFVNTLSCYFSLRYNYSLRPRNVTNNINFPSGVMPNVPLMIATFAYLNQQRLTNETMIIDVRTPEEVHFGAIDAHWWANTPLSEFRQAFALDAAHFEEQYQARKPGLSDDVILQCRSGARSKIAQYMLVDLGFNNTKNFEGGFNLFQAKTLAEQPHLAWRLNPVTVN